MNALFYYYRVYSEIASWLQEAGVPGPIIRHGVAALVVSSPGLINLALVRSGIDNISRANIQFIFEKIKQHMPCWEEPVNDCEFRFDFQFKRDCLKIGDKDGKPFLIYDGDLWMLFKDNMYLKCRKNDLYLS